MANIAFLFPGTGSQTVGMGREFYEQYPEFRRVYECAGDLFGFDVAKLALEGSAEEISGTAVSHRLIYAMSMGVYEVSLVASWGPWWWWMPWGACVRVCWQMRAATWTRVTTMVCWNIPTIPVHQSGMAGRYQRYSRTETMPKSISGGERSRWKIRCANARIYSVRPR